MTNNFTFFDIFKKIREAFRMGSYFISITSKDPKKTENDLNHIYFRKNFDLSNINPSLDCTIRSLDVKLKKPVDVIVPPKIAGDKKPLRLAIISHFNSMPASYSPARAVRNQIKMLSSHGHKVTIFLQEGSKLTEEELGCEIKRIIPKFKRIKMVVNQEIKEKLINLFRTEVEGNYDVVITHDFYLQDTVTFSEAIRECGIKTPFLNFARSGVGHNMDFSMSNAKFVYLNYSDVESFAKAIKVPVEQCRTVPNEKEIFYMFNFHPVTKMIIQKFQLWEKDIIMTCPVCSTRLDAKGIDSIIKTFVELKRLGRKVTLIVANSNGRKRVDDLKRKQEMVKEMGLNDDEFIFTSLLADEEFKIESEVPNQVCAELMQLSNLMIMATTAEVSSNILLEASMTKQLLVLNSDLPCLFDAVDKKNVLSYPFTSNKSLHYTGRDSESLSKLAKQIIQEIESNKADMQFRYVWRNYNSHSLYKNFLEPILYESINENNPIPTKKV